MIRRLIAFPVCCMIGFTGRMPIGAAEQPTEYLVAVANAESATPVPQKDVEIGDVARRILDDALSDEAREALIAQNPAKAAELVVAMTANIPDDAKEEYRRIPWIWRVAVACGRRNQPEQILPLLRVSIPKSDLPLRDWQAVVIGGGIINGIGLSGGWPRSRVNEIIRDDADLKTRWQACILHAVPMADDEKIATGTRYDALRIVAMDDSKPRHEQLIRYLAKGTHDELQMGAISGLSDVESEIVPSALLENLGHFNDENRGLALDALIRTDFRTLKLLDAIADGRVTRSMLSSAQKKSLRESKSPSVSERAMKVLSE